jgi:Domain of unknown function (DUF4281)
MSPDSFYSYVSFLIFIPWGLLIFLPKGKYTEFVAFGTAILLLLVAAWFTIQYLFNGENDGHFISLEGIKNIFRSNEMLLTGWLNYLSFCLITGAWQVHDARQLKIPHIFIVPGLILTMLTGPAGVLVYILIRFFKTKKWEI